jgi:hypothetical protein
MAHPALDLKVFRPFFLALHITRDVTSDKSRDEEGFSGHLKIYKFFTPSKTGRKSCKNL